MTLTTWPSVVMLLCILGSYCARRYLPVKHLFQTDFGAFMLSVITALLSATAHVVQSKGLNGPAIVQSCVAATLALLAALNPTSAQVASVLARKARTSGSTVAAIAFFCLVGMGLSSCATPGAIALKNCEVGSLPQTEQSVLSCVVSAAAGGGDVQTLITSCGTGLVGTQFNCLVQAVLAWYTGKVPAHGQVDAVTIAAIAHLQVWLNANKGTSCNDSDVNHALRKIDPRMTYASVSQ